MARAKTENAKAGIYTAVQLSWLVAKLQHKNTVPNTTIYPSRERAEASQQTAELLALDMVMFPAIHLTSLVLYAVH